MVQLAADAEPLTDASGCTGLTPRMAVADATPAALLRGHPDPTVAAMIATPRRQAERLAGL